MYSSSGIRSSTAGVANLRSFLTLNDFVSPIEIFETKSLLVFPELLNDLFLPSEFDDFPSFILQRVRPIEHSHITNKRTAAEVAAIKTTSSNWRELS